MFRDQLHNCRQRTQISFLEDTFWKISVNDRLIVNLTPPNLWKAMKEVDYICSICREGKTLHDYQRRVWGRLDGRQRWRHRASVVRRGADRRGRVRPVEDWWVGERVPRRQLWGAYGGSRDQLCWRRTKWVERCCSCWTEVWWRYDGPT